MTNVGVALLPVCPISGLLLLVDDPVSLAKSGFEGSMNGREILLVSGFAGKENVGHLKSMS